MNSEFSDWLRGQIDRLGMTYQEFGGIVGSTHSSVSQWVSGQHLPRPPQLRRIAEVTHADPVELFRMVGYLPGEVVEADREGEIPPKLMRAMRRAVELPDDLLDLVVRQFELVLQMNRMRGDQNDRSTGGAEGGEDGDNR